MKKLLAIAFFWSFVFLNCSSEPRSLSDQLESNLRIHLNKIDSTVNLDSFHIDRVDTMVEKLGRIIDDTLYKIAKHRVEEQLASALREKKLDSAEFYQGEVNYMITQSDSLTKAISTGDTTKKFGLLVSATAWISRDKKVKNTRMFYFLDRRMTIRNSERMDSILASEIRRLN